MGEVIAHLAMSLDGFIADPDDGWNGHPDPEVTEDRGVTHLRYRVRREG
jgi:hypothetical protein